MRNMSVDTIVNVKFYAQILKSIKEPLHKKTNKMLGRKQRRIMRS